VEIFVVLFCKKQRCALDVSISPIVTNVQYIGRSIKLLIDRKDEPWAFRIHKSRVYYMPERVLRQAAPIGKKDLISVGTCFGKFSKNMKFKLHVTALPHIAQYAKYKVWVKPSSEMSFLYGNHVLKAGKLCVCACD
jgi:60S ribosome subunit biogenesis protein NIP7